MGRVKSTILINPISSAKNVCFFTDNTSTVLRKLSKSNEKNENEQTFNKNSHILPFIIYRLIDMLQLNDYY